MNAPAPWLILAMVSLAAAAAPSSLWLQASSSDDADVLLAANWTRFVALAICFVAVSAYLSKSIRLALTTKLFIFSIPLISIALFASFKRSAGVENSLYLALVREDSLIEYASAGLFFIASLLTVRNSVMAWKLGLKLAAVFQIGLGGLMLFMALEEVSYGQRIFGIETPAAISADNTQRELNFHNLSSLKWLMQDMAPGWIINWGVFGWLGLALLAIFIDRRSAAFRTAELALPPWYLSSYFIPFALWAYHSFWNIWTSAIWQDQEITELYLALAFLAFSLASNYKLRDYALSPEGPPLQKKRSSAQDRQESRRAT